MSLCGCSSSPSDNRGDLKESNGEVGSELSVSATPARSGWLRTMALAGTVALGPHAVCLLSAGGLGLGGYAITSWCGHGEKASDGSFGVTIPRMSSVPEEYSQISGVSATRGRELLLAIEPRFNEIIAAKAQEAEGKPIEVVFLREPNDRVSVVLCKEGSLCPCQKPQVYELGRSTDVLDAERFPGQHLLLHTLLGEPER